MDRRNRLIIIMAQVGRYFFGTSVPLGVRRKRAKELFNALDNDGGIREWRRRFGVPEGEKPLQDLNVWIGGGRKFDLAAYQESRRDVAEEFERRMPLMVSFVTGWLKMLEVTG